MTKNQSKKFLQIINSAIQKKNSKSLKKKNIFQI